MLPLFTMITNGPMFQTLTGFQRSGKKAFAVLVDPDKYSQNQLDELIEKSMGAGVDLFLVGGSLLTKNGLAKVIAHIKKKSSIPVILFPGSILQIDNGADALLLLSLISGRNADLLIGKHVEAAPFLKSSPLEIIPTAYMVVDGGRSTTVSYISGTLPLPADKPDIAACTVMAGEMLGLRLAYIDSGSGALNPVSGEMIQAVRESCSIPLIVGGGITNPGDAHNSAQAGADVVVVGNALEKDPHLLEDLAFAVHDIGIHKSTLA